MGDSAIAGSPLSPEWKQARLAFIMPLNINVEKPMNYWLVCLPREDLEHCLKIGVFGLARKNIISNVRQGDKIVCCAAKGEWKIIAMGEASSDYYLDDESVFLKPGYFVDRFKMKTQILSPEIDLISLLDQLSFITNLAYWAVYFRNGIVKLNHSDWKLFEKSISKQKQTSS